MEGGRNIQEKFKNIFAKGSFVTNCSALFLPKYVSAWPDCMQAKRPYHA